MKRICIVRLSALGDVCLVVPLVRALQRSLPSAQITWVIGKDAFPIVSGIPDINFVTFNKAAGVAEYLRVGSLLRKQPAFDILLALQASLRANLIYPWIRAGRKIGFDRRRARDAHGLFVNETIPPARQHFVDAYLSFAVKLGMTPQPAEWHLPISAEDRSIVQSMIKGCQRPLIAINPATSRINRNWPLDRYANLMIRANRTWPVSFILTGGPGREERNVSDALMRLLPRDVEVINTTGNTSIPQMLALLSEADVLIAGDTGPVHFADAVGTPVVGLYTAAPSALSGPYHSRHLTVDKFDEAARQLLGRDPGTLPWNTRVHHPQAMELITVPEVFDKLTEVMNAKDGS